jgi:hypothetical protein
MSSVLSRYQEIREVSVPDEVFSSSDMEGKYNSGYLVDEGFDWLGGEIAEEQDGAVLWTPIDGMTPEMETQGDLLSYHLARQRNAETMRKEGLEVPEVSVVKTEMGSGYGTFLATPYVEHECFDQRPQVPGGDSRRNNPHMKDPYRDPERESFEAEIDRALEGIDGEELVESGRIVNAGNGSIDEHNKNWGLVDGELVRLDIGEVPAEGAVWEEMPYSGPEEFYHEEGISQRASRMLEEMEEISPEDSIPEEYRDLM